LLQDEKALVRFSGTKCLGIFGNCYIGLWQRGCPAGLGMLLMPWAGLGHLVKSGNIRLG